MKMIKIQFALGLLILFQTTHAFEVPLDKSESANLLKAFTGDDIQGDSVETGTLTVNPTLRNFSFDEEEKMRKAIILLEKVVNSEEFKQAVLNFQFKGKNEFYQNKGMSNLEIYLHLMSGKENLLPSEDLEADIDVTLYRQRFFRCSVVGYTTPKSPKIFVNKCYFKNYKSNQIAANLFHEWSHKMGFGHDYKKNENRVYSVPYGLGGIVSKLGEKFNDE